MAEKKQLILVVEGTAAMGSYWQTIVSEYLEKIIRCFCGNDLTQQKPVSPAVELALVMFNTYGSHSAWLVQRSGWTRHPGFFFEWLSAIQFCGGGFDNAAIAEGLDEALMMFPSPNGGQTQQNADVHRHCILISASNPYLFPTPVYRPQRLKSEQSDNSATQSQRRLSDAETVAKSFSQCAVSLSVICPKQLPKLRAIYNAGKRNPRAADPPIDNVKNPHFLVLISENFKEALGALNRAGMTNLPLNQSPVKMDVTSVPPVSVSLPTSIPPVNGSITNQQPMSLGSIGPATVKVEPSTVPSMVSGMSSGNGAMMPTPGMPQHVPSGMQSFHVNNNGSANVPLSQQTSSALPSAQSEYVKVWEGDFFAQRQGQPVFITRLEGYQRASASKTLVDNWPPKMHIIRLISDDHMNDKQYVGKADFLVFRAMNQHGFLVQLQEKKLCAVIELPSQTLLLSVFDKVSRLIGMLFSGDLVVFKPKAPGQQLQPQQQSQLQQQQQIAEVQQPQQIQQQQIQQPSGPAE